MRCFVGLELPEPARAALPRAEDPWRPVAPESLHVTVAFLGSIEPGAVPGIAAALAALARPLGPLATAGAIALPPRRPRVLAVRLEDPSGASVALAAEVSAALAELGAYEPERRPWLPHVTIARARGPVDRRAALPEVPRLELTPPALTLFRSHLGAQRPARYEALARFAL